MRPSAWVFEICLELQSERKIMVAVDDWIGVVSMS